MELHLSLFITKSGIVARSIQNELIASDSFEGKFWAF